MIKDTNTRKNGKSVYNTAYNKFFQYLCSTNSSLVVQSSHMSISANFVLNRFETLEVLAVSIIDASAANIVKIKTMALTT